MASRGRRGGSIGSLMAAERVGGRGWRERVVGVVGKVLRKTGIELSSLDQVDDCDSIGER